MFDGLPWMIESRQGVIGESPWLEGPIVEPNMIDLELTEPGWIAQDPNLKSTLRMNKRFKPRRLPKWQKKKFDKDLQGADGEYDTAPLATPKAKSWRKAYELEDALIRKIDNKESFPIQAQAGSPSSRVIDQERNRSCRWPNAAKPQLPQDESAKRPAKSVQDFWETKINAAIDEYVREQKLFNHDHPDVYHDEGKPIWRQDKNGNLVGQQLTTVRRTMVSHPQREQEMDAKIATFAQRKASGAATKREEAAMISYFTTLAEAGAPISKGKEAMKKIRQRLYAPTAGLSEVIDTLWDGKERGWFIIVKLRRRPAYLYPLDVPDNATDDQLAEAIDRGVLAEAVRISAAELVRKGLKKLTTPGGEATEEAKAMMDAIWARVSGAFKKGYLVRNSDCHDPECPSCSSRSMSPPDAKVEGQKRQETKDVCELYFMRLESAEQVSRSLSPLAARAEGQEDADG